MFRRMMGSLFSMRGRIGRPGFWLACLSVFAILLLIGLILPLIGCMCFDETDPDNVLSDMVSMGLMAALLLLSLWILAAAGVKRCHDLGRPGSYCLIALIPFAGWIWFFAYLGFMAGEEGPTTMGRPTHDPLT